MDSLLLLKDIEFIHRGFLVDSLSEPMVSIHRLVIEACIFLRGYLSTDFSSKYGESLLQASFLSSRGRTSGDAWCYGSNRRLPDEDTNIQAQSAGRDECSECLEERDR